MSDPREPAADAAAELAITMSELLDLLVLTPLGDDSYRAEQSRRAPAIAHVYGGLVAAQAVVAAYDTVGADRALHSLHAYFLRPGDPTVPITMVVERTRDGRAFSHRRVSAEQHGRAILQVSLSFAVAEDGLAHQVAMPDVAGPETLRPLAEVVAELPGDDPFVTTPGPFEIRSVGAPSQATRGTGETTDRSRFWVRAAGPTPGDPVLQQALLVYASDEYLLDPTVRPHDLSMTTGDVLPLTIDHTMWFHAPLRTDEWWLYAVESPWAGRGRGFARGQVFAADGTLVCEVAQEGLIRRLVDER